MFCLLIVRSDDFTTAVANDVMVLRSPFCLHFHPHWLVPHVFRRAFCYLPAIYRLDTTSLLAFRFLTYHPFHPGSCGRSHFRPPTPITPQVRSSSLPNPTIHHDRSSYLPLSYDLDLPIASTGLLSEYRPFPKPKEMRSPLCAYTASFAAAIFKLCSSSQGGNFGLCLLLGAWAVDRLPPPHHAVCAFSNTHGLFLFWQMVFGDRLAGTLA